MRLFKLIAIYMLGFSDMAVNGQQVVASAGNYYQNYSGSLAFTIGEPIVATYSQTETVLTQGIHQPVLLNTILMELAGLGSLISAFPNPTVNMVTLKLPNLKFLSFRFILMDINGQVLQQKKIVDVETEIPFDKLSSGTYFINVYVGAKQVKILKIIKL